MGVDSIHPEYTEHLTDWQQMRDTYEGERIVKSKGTKYLPFTTGMISDGVEASTQKGYQTYESYRTRARVPDFTKEAVEALLGSMHRRPATISLPEGMEFLRENATARNESLQMLLRRVNEQQLVAGRVGMLADVVDKGARADQPYISVYEAEHITNWDEGQSDGIEVENLNMVILDESSDERVDDFEWQRVQKHRVLLLTRAGTSESASDAVTGRMLDNGSDVVPNIPEGEGIYQMGVFREATSFSPDGMLTPSIRGKSLNEVPFVFVNAKDIVPEPDQPPLLGLSNLQLAVYRGEADYRQSLFMQGQDTLVLIGMTDDDEDQRVGAGASIRVSMNGDAKYIGVDSEGLGEQRVSLENDYNRAGDKGGHLLDAVGSGQQSGEALRIRVSAKTATIFTVAMAGAYGLETILKKVARWMGLDDKQVIVVPNLEFADDRVPGDEIVKWMTAKELGVPLSLKTIHKNLQDRGQSEMSFEDEVSAIKAEKELGILPEKPEMAEKGQDNQVIAAKGPKKAENGEKGGSDEETAK